MVCCASACLTAACACRSAAKVWSHSRIDTDPSPTSSFTRFMSACARASWACAFCMAASCPATCASLDRWLWLEFLRLARSEEHTSELQSLMRISYAVFCLKKTNNQHTSKLCARQVLHYI